MKQLSGSRSKRVAGFVSTAVGLAALWFTASAPFYSGY